ncbi:hypothetical protein E2K93_12990 [Thalassotalea sp. HSM 43]|uniref:hypothetical protein n=1 Tax=Thalassotalea sp. HSM 43 TaxID=2552945 RepID=UPI0010817EA6|nr:hypothetical protein [Thalassotalea sp. HSM 43]QBY05240.1 hypothetical protein E2K93_12990 [Thalassotalea sp. HSM 43]
MTSNNKTQSFGQQIKQHMIAIISMIIAITSLSYNTWRNEVTEHNRNVRTSSFEILKSLADLQLLVDSAYYDKTPLDNIRGWRFVLYINDLSKTVNVAVESDAAQLHNLWGDHWQHLETKSDSNEQVNKAIEEVRSEVLSTLNELD